MTRTTRIFVHRLVSIKSLCCVLLFLSMSMNLCLAQTLQSEYIPGVLMIKFGRRQGAGSRRSRSYGESRQRRQQSNGPCRTCQSSLVTVLGSYVGSQDADRGVWLIAGRI